VGLICVRAYTPERRTLLLLQTPMQLHRRFSFFAARKKMGEGGFGRPALRLKRKKQSGGLFFTPWT